MGLTFSGLVVRNERRVRLVFSDALGAAAFGPGTSVAALYVVTSVDGSGASPPISAAIPIPNAPGNVDLALGDDLVAGGVYQVATINVPGADGSASPAATEPFTFGALAAPTLNVEQPQDDIDALVYGVDLVHTGSDYLETGAGDLATVSGIPNFQGAMQRRLTDEDGIPWDQTYGAKSGSFVNGPAASGGTLVSSLRRQSVSDDRVRSASVSWMPDPASPGDNYFPVTITPRGASAGSAPLTVNVYPPGTS